MISECAKIIFNGRDKSRPYIQSRYNVVKSLYVRGRFIEPIK